jgi:hypothetical protein
MALKKEVFDICQELAKHGWAELLQQVTTLASTDSPLNIIQANEDDLEAELLKDRKVNRTIAGFEDFARDGAKGITPGKAGQSLLYHALASPNVISATFQPEQYPTLKQIETIENYVYAVTNRSIRDLKKYVEEMTGDKQNLAVCVFAYEYRPSIDTPHRKHADLCFSRTGMARVGNSPALYNRKLRGFEPTVSGDKYGIRVQPSHFGAFLAMKVKGDKEKFIPMNFKTNTPADFPEKTNPADVGDDARSFWLPVHKLFSGTECIQGMDLNFDLKHYHENEKLRRIHLTLGAAGFDSGWHEPDISNAPFRVNTGLAEFGSGNELSLGMLMPEAHNLVEKATYKNAPLTFNVPIELAQQGINGLYFIDGTTLGMPTAETPERITVRSAPEYVHIRHKLQADGTDLDLNTRPDIVVETARENYRAIHYIDFTADGIISVNMPEELAIEITTKPLSAYSIIAAPDFFPCVDQREIMEWTQEQNINAWFIPPSPLSSTRVLPNVQLRNSDFDLLDDTLTSIVSHYYRDFQENSRIRGLADGSRSSWLPDAGAGVFAPGWESTVDISRQTGKIHLAAYGLGSPFPEDAKLCAAINAFWPAVAPDVARSVQNYDNPGRLFFSVAPLTDNELGWDGTRTPKLVTKGDKQYIEYQANEYTDWTLQALNNKIEIEQLCKIDTNEYKHRVHAMHFSYKGLGLSSNQQKRNQKLLHFEVIDPTHAESVAAENQTGKKLGGNRLYRLELYSIGTTGGGAILEPSENFNTILVQVENKSVVIISPVDLFVSKEGANWQYQLIANFV